MIISTAELDRYIEGDDAPYTQLSEEDLELLIDLIDKYGVETIKHEVELSA